MGKKNDCLRYVRKKGATDARGKGMALRFERSENAGRKMSLRVIIRQKLTLRFVGRKNTLISI